MHKGFESRKVLIHRQEIVVDGRIKYFQFLVHVGGVHRCFETDFSMFKTVFKVSNHQPIVQLSDQTQQVLFFVFWTGVWKQRVNQHNGLLWVALNESVPSAVVSFELGANQIRVIGGEDGPALVSQKSGGGVFEVDHCFS